MTIWDLLFVNKMQINKKRINIPTTAKKSKKFTREEIEIANKHKVFFHRIYHFHVSDKQWWQRISIVG